MECTVDIYNGSERLAMCILCISSFNVDRRIKKNFNKNLKYFWNSFQEDFIITCKSLHLKSQDPTMSVRTIRMVLISFEYGAPLRDVVT